jgi:CubicO group peptidase (beta-lactamase class C family)
MVHHLLTHTSGISNDSVKAFDQNAFAEKRSRIPPPDETEHPMIHEWLHIRYDVPLWKPPGREMSYCTLNYELLGEIVRRVSGRSFADFCREQILKPVGMTDTHFGIPDTSKGRVVRRPADAPGAEFISMPLLEVPLASGTAVSTAADLAAFGQTFLNGGSYGQARILSPASVDEMTRNQIPGIGASWGDEFFAEASWGLGWNVQGSKKPLAGATLLSCMAFSHGGAGGVGLWIDPTYDLVVVYLSVASLERWPSDVALPEEVRPGLMNYTDLFVNAVTAAIIDT